MLIVTYLRATNLTQDSAFASDSHNVFGIGTCPHVCAMYEIHNLMKRYIWKEEKLQYFKNLYI